MTIVEAQTFGHHMNSTYDFLLNFGIQIHSVEQGGKRIQFVSLKDGNQSVLFDCGLPGFCEKVGIFSNDVEIRRLILSHADADHFGDAGNLKRRYPALEVFAHYADRPWIQDPKLIVHERYDHARKLYGFGYSHEELAALEAACGNGIAVDTCLTPYTALEIGTEVWAVLHVPGHSPGHIALWNSNQGTLLLGDAVLGFGIPSVSEDLAMPPTHQFIEDYLETIETLSALSAKTVITGHWPVLDNDGFHILLQQSKECVQRDLDFVRDRIAKGPTTFQLLMQDLNDEFRRWSPSEDIHYSYALAGYLEYLYGSEQKRKLEGLSGAA